MTDIVERLRNKQYDCCNESLRCNKDLMDEAADEIERLQEALRLMPKTITKAADEIERLRKKISKMDAERFMRDVIGGANWKQVCKENDDMRKALREIHGLGDTPDDSWKAYQICCKALGEKE